MVRSITYTPEDGRAVERVVTAGQKHRWALGRMVFTVELGIEPYRQGFNMIVYRSDIQLLHRKRGTTMNRFRVALSGDLMKPDGSPAFPSFDLKPITDDPRIENAFLERKNFIEAEDLEGFDALILLSAKFRRESFPADGRLSLIARCGVGFDSVDVPSCTESGAAVVNTPDAFGRPVVAAVITDQ